MRALRQAQAVPGYARRTGGAYSYLNTGQYAGFNGIQGRRHGGLHFAGEHTSGNFQGYLEGALRSGYRCAAEITSG